MSEHRDEGAKVPNEVLVQILSRVPTADLLKTCRLVSRRWNKVTALACRQRQVKFESGANFENLQVCAAAFKHPETVPWSAISLSTSSSLLATHSGQVAEIFGPTITSLQLTCSNEGTFDADCFENVLKIFSHTPNLRHLEIFKISDENLSSLVPCLLETRPQHLSAQVTYTGESLSWTLLANQREVTLENLTLISIGPIPSVDYFRPLERFLASCGGGLKSLKIVGFLSVAYTEPQESTLLKIPALPNLKKIAFLVFTGPDHFYTLRRHFHFEELRAAQFPALTTVQFQTESAWEGRDLEHPRLSVSDVFGPLDEESFATVTTLCLGEHFAGDQIARYQILRDQISRDQISRDRIREYAEWGLKFPNVTHLDAHLWWVEHIQGIVAYFPKLEVLHLSIHECAASPNATLCQMLEFLPSLTALKRLTITDVSDHYRVSDPGAIVLILLHPLDLTITNARLSDNCVALLRQRHLHFELI